MEDKEYVDALSKEADLAYKKSIILLAASGGSGSYAISETGWISLGLFVLFGIFVIGVIINYQEINTCKQKIRNIING